jgi:hypothetical protein
MFRALKYGMILASAWLAAGPLHASSIDSFTFIAADSPFTTSLFESFTNSEAIVSGTVTCDSTTVCIGPVGTFNLGVDFTDPSTPLSVDVSGDLSGPYNAGASVRLRSPLHQAFPFLVTDGSFDDNLVSAMLPPLGMTNIVGGFYMRMAPGQSVVLPIIIGLDEVTATPEPSGEALIVVCLLGFAGLVRYRYTRTVRS